MNQEATSRGSWELRSIHTNNPDSDTYDVLNAAGEAVFEINRIHTEVGEREWKTNLQLVKHAPQLVALVERQQAQLRLLIESREANTAELRQTMEDADTVLAALSDAKLKTPR